MRRTTEVQELGLDTMHDLAVLLMVAAAVAGVWVAWFMMEVLP